MNEVNEIVNSNSFPVIMSSTKKCLDDIPLWVSRLWIWACNIPSQIKWHSGDGVLRISLDTRSLECFSRSFVPRYYYNILTGFITSLRRGSIQMNICYEGVFKEHFSSVQFSSFQSISHVWLCNPMNCSTPGPPVHHHLLEFTQTHVHWVGDAIQPSHPLSSPSPPAFSLFQHQGRFQWVSSSHQVSK